MIARPTPPARSGRAVWARPALLAALPVVLAVAALFPVTRHYFYADDFIHLFSLVNNPLARFLLEPFAFHLLVFRNAVFFLTFQLFGMEPEGYFVLALLTHALNAFLLFRAISGFTGSTRLSSFGAALWGTMPILEGSLGWYSVYGHVLLGTFVALLLLSLARWQTGDAPVPLTRVVYWVLLALVGSTCFGTGLGFAASVPVVVLLMIPWSRLPAGTGGVLLNLPLVIGVLYLLALWAYLTPEQIEAARTFSRMAALRYIVETLGYLLLFAVSQLLLGAVVSFATFPNWVAYDVGIAVIAGVLVTVAVCPNRVRRQVAGLLVLTVGLYVPITLAKGSGAVVFGAPPYYLAMEARYHYAGLLPLAVIVCLAALATAEHYRVPTRVGELLFAFWIGLLSGTLLVGERPFKDHAYDRRETALAMDAMYALIAEANPGDEVLIRNRKFPPTRLYADSMPGWAGLFLLHHPSGVVGGRRVRFVMPAEEYHAFTARGGPLARLIVPEAPPVLSPASGLPAPAP